MRNDPKIAMGAAEASPLTSPPLPQQPPRPLEYWRGLRAERPRDVNKMLRDALNDLVLEELDDSPPRTVALLRLPPLGTPAVGQLCRVALSDDALSESSKALVHAREHHGGFLCCVPTVKDAKALPRGGVGVEVVDVAAPAGIAGVELVDGAGPPGQTIVTLRGVAALRILERGPSQVEWSHRWPLMQEVFEWSPYEDQNGGEDAVLELLGHLQELFATCGDLQERTGLRGAGDFIGKSLDQRTDEAMAVLTGVRIGGMTAEFAESPRAAAQRRAIVAAHAAEGVFSSGPDGQRIPYICDPVSVHRRLRRLINFLTKMETLLRNRL